LSVLPLAFDYGLYQALMCVKVGATLVLEQSFAYPALILEKLRREQVTGLPLVPTHRGDPVAAERSRARRVPAAALYHQYGRGTAARAHRAPAGAVSFDAHSIPCTGDECKRCTYLPPEQLAVRPGSVASPFRAPRPT